jgi:ASC-1-like (ASCH) protein
MFKHLWQVLVVLLVVLLVLVALALSRARRPAYGGDRDDDDDGSGADWEGSDYEGVGGGGGFQLRLRDPGYTHALDGKKTVEARPNRPPFDKVKAGETITVARSRPQGDTAEYEGPRRFTARVGHTTKYPTFKALVAGEGLEALAPGVKTEAAAAKAFREFTSEEAEKEHGLVAIGFKREAD